MRKFIVKYWLAATKPKTRTQNYKKQSNHNYSSVYENFYSQGFTLLGRVPNLKNTDKALF